MRPMEVVQVQGAASEKFTVLGQGLPVRPPRSTGHTLYRAVSGEHAAKMAALSATLDSSPDRYSSFTDSPEMAARYAFSQKTPHHHVCVRVRKGTPFVFLAEEVEERVLCIPIWARGPRTLTKRRRGRARPLGAQKVEQKTPSDPGDALHRCAEPMCISPPPCVMVTWRK
jgi:hypothetical protein